ncbi:MAG: elongation factor P maturation arginine rhamnosyltransferase EarP [Nitrosomonadales bacterium]|nr:elongation factor P maturation arginine rhamnosyltransferase EarP [Nitrosomonadales bacterium]
MRSESCDIFCNVVDNYGDIGVCWRLARQLANEHGLAVRLWVDDLRSFGKLCPELDAGLAEQRCRGVEVRRWNADFPVVEPSTLVIEAFACRLPQSYVGAMAVREPKPVWLNLEYLSAEDWVEGCHKLPSPHPSLPLTKYFFFPGFTKKTGGLLLERDLLARRDAFQGDGSAKTSPTPALPRGEREFWRNLGVPERVAGEVRVSLFSYENEAMEGLLRGWEQGGQLVTCLLPEGRSLPQVAGYFGLQAGIAGDVWQRGNLRVQVLPFVEQERYDELLWACDVNFVRGEDSCVRAQWAAKPFIWQIYPQHDGVHLAKLEALRMRYTAGLPPETAQTVRDLWLAWNGGPDIAGAWAHFAAQRGVLTRHGAEWARRLESNNLALNLLDFYRQTE